MKITLVIFFLQLIKIFHSHEAENYGNYIKNLKTLECEKIQIEEITEQLDAVEEIEFDNYHTLWIFTNNDFMKIQKFIASFVEQDSRHFVSKSKNNNYLSMIEENFLLYSSNETINTKNGYLLYRSLNKPNSEIFLKYFINRQMNKASKVNVLKNSKAINLFLSSMNNIYEEHWKNFQNVNKSEIDLWTKFYLQSLAKYEKTFLNLNFSSEWKFSEKMNCSTIAINEYLIDSFQEVADHIFTHYFNLEATSTNDDKFVNELTKAHVILNSAVEKVFQILDTKNFVERESFEPFVSALSELEIKIPENYFFPIARKVNQINFLHMARGGLKQKLGFVLEPVKRIIENEIGASILWYGKLKIAYITAGRSLSNNLHSNMRRKIDQLSGHFSLKALNSKIKEKQLKELESYSFNRDLRKECILLEDQMENKVYKLSIRGDFVTFRDIPDIEVCRGQTRYIELFAREVLLVDKNLIRIGDMVQVVAVSPKWIVIDSRVIDLRGAEGEDYETSAEDGQLGVRGEDGLPGLPGGSGGIFIGIADEIVNNRNLTIWADGGLGGTGQNGGKGGKGPDTRLPTVDDYDEAILIETKVRHYFPFFQEMDDICLVYNFDIFTISSAGDGGNGGRGGFGGNAGKIFIVQVDHLKAFEEHLSKRGEVGYDGLGGAGGAANFKIENVEEKCYDRQVKASFSCQNCTIRERIQLVVRNGTAGLNGTNAKRIKQPFDFVGFKEIDFVLNDYKTYIRPFLSDSKKDLFKFHEKLIKNELINKQYSTFGLLDELKGLEIQYLGLENVDLPALYKNLEKRIEKYVQSHLNSGIGDDYLVALDYAYTAVLTKASRLTDNVYFVHDLQNYIESVSENIKKLKDNIVEYSANQLGEDYKQSIERRIEEARIIIDEQLFAAIDKGNNLIKKKIYNLINETLGLRNESQEKKKALKTAMMQQTVLSLLKSALVGISALIPGGQAAAIVAFTALQVGESFAPEYSTERFQTRMPSAVGNRFTGALEFLKNSKLEQQKILENNLEFLKKEKNKLEETNLQRLNETIIADEISNLDKQVETLTLRKEDSEGTDYTKVFDVVGKLKAYYNLKQKNTDAVDQLENDTERKQSLKDTISSTESDIKKLQTYENRIYNELIPVFEKMSLDLPSDETLRIESVTALDVSKWKVQATLKNLKLILRQFTKGFNVENDLDLIVEHLEDTINTLITIYDEIQNYQQEKKLAAYIKQLNNLKFKTFHSKNQLLENSVLETRSIIRVNLALIQYAKVYQAFKQFIFPFAGKYMKDLYKPKDLSDLSDIRSNTMFHWFGKISESVDKIKDKMNLIQATIFRNSKFNERLEYGNKHQGEIYLWQNESHHEMISDLLSGKEVLLFPNARKFPHFALKFRKIRIGFVAKNKTDQKLLTDLLNPLEMKMTHAGNSYYTCGEKMYLISHSPITLTKTFNESYQGESDSVQKLASGDDLVSPFATWRVKIRKATGNIDENYFAVFKNKVDLVLEGVGTYVKLTNTDICNKDTVLTEYYQEYIPIV